MKILLLPVIFAIMGFLFTSDQMILFMDKLTPSQGLLFYYSILFLSITALQYFGLVIGDVTMNSPIQTFGNILVLFAFFIIVDFESRYIQWVVDDNKVRQHSENCTGVYLQSEDGATFDLINGWVKNPRVARIITFVLLPFILTLIGLYLASGKVELSIW